MRSPRILIAALIVSSLSPRLAGATFHEMQIEQVIGGLNGFTSVQAVQLRMRAVGQNFVSQGQLVVRDATGANPVTLIAFPSDVGNGAIGDRVLVATAGFASATVPSLTPDFIFTNPIPDSYLAAGTLTYETLSGFVLWRLSWGGAGYTGIGTGLTFNDADGNFSPPFAGPLPSSGSSALFFPGVATALSTNNAADYALTSGSATFTNNGHASGTINAALSVDPASTAGGLSLEAPSPNPVAGRMRYAVVLPRPMSVRVRILDLAGRAERELVNGTLPAGRHDYAWSASASAGPAMRSGVYFLEMTADGARRVRRFVLVPR